VSALENHSKFYYGWQITNSNKNIDFNDGSGVKTATLKVGYYSSTELIVEIKKKMDALSSLDFTISFNRTTRKFTISSTSNFSLLFSTGLNSAQSTASLLGYSATDKTGASTYLAENVSGFEYKTQFYIQSYKDTSTNRKAIDGTVNKSASGVIEVIKFGNERFMEGEFLFITNIIQESQSIIRTNIQGREDFIQFIEWCTEKAPVEFMRIENDPSTYQQLVLESTPTDSKGLDYDLIEMYDRGLAQYYRSGVLKFRLIS
jgi:hypothetical protein